jgi:hypothetical protein
MVIITISSASKRRRLLPGVNGIPTRDFLSMPPRPSSAAFDKALAGIAGLASKSAKLSPAEKRELKALAVKGMKTGKQGFTMSDRARCVWLIRKAGPEKLPNIKIPPRLRKLLGLLPEGDEPQETPEPLRGGNASLDPLDRLEKLGRLRGKPLTEAQFGTQRSRILADPLIGQFGEADGADPLDRLTRVGEFEASGVLTAKQAAQVTQQILDGS